MFVCSPNNPTGTVEPRDDRRAARSRRGRAGALLVVDEAYGEFAPWSALELVDDDRPLVVVRTYSKVWSLAALRLGFAVAPPWVVAELEKVVLPYHLVGADAARGHDRARLRAPRWSSGSRRSSRSGAGCSPRSPSIDRHRPCARRAPTSCCSASHGDAHELWQRLLDRGVLVRDFSRWPRLDGCLRVTVGTPDENDAFLAALARVAPRRSAA